ncbi:hypothetical protein MLD38_028635 [Melastoma candidum]|uniref:Uncharacterized protein n=1 Tax=Melastoma candidum TaxID=119954 RepID=A0ACB9N1N2_9MYRT|nr:hypothetical protein MLD38_028635 [Melastoma candidum]
MTKPRKPIQWINKGLSLSLNGRARSRRYSDSSTTSPSHRPSREDELREVFRRFDEDGDGRISATELRSFFASIGEYMSHEEAQGVINELDTDGDGQVNFEDFVSLMRMDGREGAGSDGDLRRAFEMFEYEKGSGCITPKGLQAMLWRLGDKKSYEECEAMIRAFDVDGNGVLDYNEFNLMMA